MINKLVWYSNKLQIIFIIVRKYFDLDITTTITDAWGWLNEFAPKMFLEAIQTNHLHFGLQNNVRQKGTENSQKKKSTNWIYLVLNGETPKNYPTLINGKLAMIS